MRTGTFLEKIRDEEVVSAIRRAEKTSSGEIRVFVTRRSVATPVIEAQRHFVRMGMQKTRDRNGVLVFVAPRSQQFAIVGDAAIHARCGQDFWNQVAAAMSDRLKQGDYTGGIVQAVERAGALLAQHFPRRPDDRNELPDRVERD